MNDKWKILVIDDNKDILFSLRMLLKPYAETIHSNTDPEQIPLFLKNNTYDVILLDMNFSEDAISGNEGFTWLQEILSIDPDAVVVFITAYGDTEKAVRAIRSGATDFVVKPWENEKLIATLSSAVALRRSKQETQVVKEKRKALSSEIDGQFSEFVGNSEEIKAVFDTINKVAATDANVLILGDNGTGKELVARSLHNNSHRRDEIFVSVDLGAIQETLFESELFGHVKGAFTDAKKDKPGRFEIANGGTLFLDEIGNLSLPLQAKLLTALERREIIRVGSTTPIPIDIRLICATNADIHDNVAKEKFRQDLYFRINTVEMQLPSLRERSGDIELLTTHFLKKFAKKYNKKLSKITKSALSKLEEYSWPGNIRELQHCMERAVIMSDGASLTDSDFIFNTRISSQNDIGIQSYNLEKVEETIIKKVMKMHKGNISKAAETLGLTRASLYRRLEKYGL